MVSVLDRDLIAFDPESCNLSIHEVTDQLCDAHVSINLFVNYFLQESNCIHTSSMSLLIFSSFLLLFSSSSFYC